MNLYPWYYCISFHYLLTFLTLNQDIALHMTRSSKVRLGSKGVGLKAALLQTAVVLSFHQVLLPFYCSRRSK